MPSSMVFVVSQLNFGLVGIIGSNVVLIQLYGLRMAMALMMFINITQKLHKHLYFVKKMNPISMVYGVGCMGCRMYIFYIHPTPQLLVNYCIINNNFEFLFVQTKKFRLFFS